jgi:hypothetical protein
MATKADAEKIIRKHPEDRPAMPNQEGCRLIGTRRKVFLNANKHITDTKASVICMGVFAGK